MLLPPSGVSRSLAATFAALLWLATARADAQNPSTLPSETPDTLRPATTGFDYERRIVDDPDARRREAAHGHPGAEGRASARRSC